MKEKNELTPEMRDPKTIWTDPTTTKAVKMQHLYDLSCNLSRRSPSEAIAYRSVSISYFCDERYVHEDMVAWFFREPKEGPDRPIKRVGAGDQQGQGKEDRGKKRKVRGTRKIDVGSMLDSFT
jgi:hypothetical protein